jgi:uncharacterized membrane protein
MMVVMVVMMMVVMVMVVMLMGHRGGRRGVLRDGVASEADRESGGGDKALDHGQLILRRKTATVFGTNLPRCA